MTPKTPTRKNGKIQELFRRIKKLFLGQAPKTPCEEPGECLEGMCALGDRVTHLKDLFESRWGENHPLVEACSWALSGEHTGCEMVMDLLVLGFEALPLRDRMCLESFHQNVGGHQYDSGDANRSAS